MSGQEDDARARYEAKVAALVGRRVLRVEYWDVGATSGGPGEWDHGDRHHAVMGIGLLTDGGPSCVLRTSIFFPYGVEVFPTPVSSHLRLGELGPTSWDASGSDRWRGLLNSPVTGAQAF